MTSPSLEISDDSQDNPALEKPSYVKLVYDIAMLIAISVDLLIISVDAILMSNFSLHVANQLGLIESLQYYQQVIHEPLGLIGGFFTAFLVTELLIRWAISIQQKQYYRWFFFPFIHWYEVLGCFPQLRALRLLRAFVIGRRLYQLGYQVLPQSWIDKGQFYYSVVLEELSDRVILTATSNMRTQIANHAQSDETMVQQIIDKSRADIEQAVLTLLRTELMPRLQATLPQTNALLAKEVGIAVQDAIHNTPELRRYLKMIPIAGNMIEGQILQVGQKIGENVTIAINQHLLESESLDVLMQHIAQGISQIDTQNPALEKLVSGIVDDSLTAFENQVKIQQWKHKKHLHL